MTEASLLTQDGEGPNWVGILSHPGMEEAALDEKKIQMALGVFLTLSPT